jgi:S1-C subfamily serine protease
MITQDYYDSEGNKEKSFVYFAKLVKPDKDHDAAILQVTHGDIPTGDAIVIADEGVDVGDTVFSLGNPLMLPHFVSKGIVSHKMAFGKREIIMHDATSDHGSSGGALVNENGELVGINDIILRRAVDLGIGIPLLASAQWSGALPVKHISKLLKDIEEYKL